MENVSKLIILDANVIIIAHKIGFWKQLISYYKIHIPATIIAESKYFENSFGQKININLSEELKNNSIFKIEASVQEMQLLYKNFKPNFVESIDDGEKEACALAIMELSEYGVSLEKVLKKAGINNKNIAKHFSEQAFKNHLGKGFQEKRLHKKG